MGGLLDCSRQYKVGADSDVNCHVVHGPRDSLNPRVHVPLVAPGVLHGAVSIAVGLIGGRMNRLCSGAEGLIVGGVGIRYVKIDHRSGRCGPSVIARIAHSDDRVSDASRGPGYTAARIESLKDLGTEGALDEAEE